jgi:catechol 2,3-dioxygenase
LDSNIAHRTSDFEFFSKLLERSPIEHPRLERAMSIPKPVYNPPFNVTRASHSVLTVKDLAVSRNFYVDLLGFIVSDEDSDALYLRGVAEACHHSLVLKRARGEPQAERVGMRVFSDEDLEKAKAFFDKAGLPATWVEVAHQGRTLHVADASGAPIEFCATMEVKPRLVVAFEHHHGAVPQRIDHFQLLVPDVRRACEFWMSLGFRLSEYISPDGSEELLFVFLQRKGNPHDIVFAPGAGPRLHHAAFSIPESYHFFYVCDLAAEMGFAANIEFGPGRHGPGHALFVYLRDPDGHRIELFNTHYQVMDIENEPVRWDASHAMKRRWQLPARRQWFVEASRFAGIEPREPARKGDPMSLEKFIAAGMR